MSIISSASYHSQASYKSHIETLQERYEAALEHFNLSAIVLASGTKDYYFQDDHAFPFHSYSGAQQWLPFTLSAETYLIIQAGKKPTLIWPVRDDFWHAPTPVPAGEWSNEWHIVEARKDDAVFSQLPAKTAWLGPNPPSFTVETTGLQAYLDYDKAIKTPYEISAMEQANLRGAKGHLAAKNAFLAGASELDIHLAFLQHSQQSASEEPYPGIVGLNEHAAVLHYENKETQNKAHSHTLLIDAGASEHGYASDITRTFTRTKDEFSALVDSLDALEQALAESVLAGVDYPSIHQQTIIGIAHCLQKHQICHLSIEEQLEKRIPQVFFPHGVGHLLGLQVHDVGGFQIDKSGTTRKVDSAPFLRLTRPLEENMVVTIEPGLYFIPMLLEKMQSEVKQHGCDFNKIQQFMPYGGIRIEDNVVAKSGRARNLTREAFKQL
ncbi:Xaa-Pro dipeptidase [Marinomonas epiphytica]